MFFSFFKDLSPVAGSPDPRNRKDLFKIGNLLAEPGYPVIDLCDGYDEVFNL